MKRVVVILKGSGAIGGRGRKETGRCKRVRRTLGVCGREESRESRGQKSEGWPRDVRGAAGCVCVIHLT